ncbi:MAG TPA: hypothetical protein VEF33_11480 [Syntrophales bacterium]|nr:hypothetical protein [Syntrophales bacterium]
MREKGADVNLSSRILDEVETLDSCVSKYFNVKSEMSPLKKDEFLILSALNIYFHGALK